MEADMTAAKGTAAKLIEVATKEIGTIEGPRDNETKYGAFTKVNFQPWCGSFVNWCGHQAGVKIPNTVYTPAGADAFKKMGRWFDARNDDPQPGDIVYFDFPEDGVNRISHVGIVVKNNGDGTITTIEGNTAGSSKGDQRNGGMVAKKIRAYEKNNKAKLINAVVGWGRPEFAGESKPVKKAAKKTVKKPVKKTGGGGGGRTTMQVM